MTDGGNRSVVIHQVSTRRSQIPFAKPKGLVQCILFHPVRPYLFVAVSITLNVMKSYFKMAKKKNSNYCTYLLLQTQKNVRVYDLVKQELFKKLLTYAQWISSIAIHSGLYAIITGLCITNNIECNNICVLKAFHK